MKISLLIFVILIVVGLTLAGSDVEVTTEAKQIPLTKPKDQFDTVFNIIDKHVPENEKKHLFKVLYGNLAKSQNVKASVQKKADKYDFEVKHESLVDNARPQQITKRRLVRIGAVQNSIVVPTNAPIQEQKQAIFDKIEKIIDAAADAGVNVLCLQEAWTAPFFFCTREKWPWMEFAEDARTGDSTRFLQRKAKEHGMVIVSPILERDNVHGGTIWNTAVIIDKGQYVGKTRKNHIPRVGHFNEATYYLEGDDGHPVFETSFGKIAVSICYSRHHPLNWLGYSLNGAEIVFNPSATTNSLSETMWPLEARTAAIANNYFTVAINRVGSESFDSIFTAGTPGAKPTSEFGMFYGSTYVTGPDGGRTRELSRLRDGLLITDVDLNHIQQIKDFWMFGNTQRLDMYAKLLNKYVKPGFKPQLVRTPKEQESQEVEEVHNPY